MKTRFFSCLAVGAALSFAACQGSGDGTDSTNNDSSTAIQSNPDNTTVNPNTAADSTSASTALDDDTKTFVMEASSGGMMEVEAGQLAQQKAMHQRVKDFGAMMVRDHSKANDELKNAVSGKTTVAGTLSDKHEGHMKDLRDKSGAEFDKAYIKMMVDDHEKDIKKFEDAAKDSKDPAVKDFANATLPTLRAHLDSAKAIRNDLSKMKNK